MRNNKSSLSGLRVVFSDPITYIYIPEHCTKRGSLRLAPIISHLNYSANGAPGQNGRCEKEVAVECKSPSLVYSTINLGIASFSISIAYHSISSLRSVASQSAYRRTPSPNTSSRPVRSSPILLHRRRFRSRFERPNPGIRRNPGCSPKFHLCA